MKRFLLTGMICFFITLAYNQESSLSRKDLTFFEIGAGATHLSDEYLMEQNRQWGFGFSLGVRFETNNQKFAFTPLLGVKEYSVAVQNQDFDNVITGFRAGLVFDIAIYTNQTKTFFLYNSFSICYARYRNFFRQETGTSTYGPYGQQQKNYDTQTIYSGGAPSFYMGYKLKYKMFFAEAGYDIVKSYITYDSSMLSAMKTQNPTMEEHPGVIFSSLNINIGISVPFSRMGRGFYF